MNTIVIISVSYTGHLMKFTKEKLYDTENYNINTKTSTCMLYVILLYVC